MRKKLLTLAAGVIVIMLIALSIYNVNRYTAKEVKQIFKIDHEKVTKIVVVDGDSGQTSVIDSRVRIFDFMNLLDNSVVKRNTSQKEKTGYRFAADIFEEGKKVLSLILGSTMKIENIYYEVVKTDLTPEKIEELLSIIEVSSN